MMLTETISSAVMPITLKANLVKTNTAKKSTSKAKTVRASSLLTKRTQVVERLWNAAESQVCKIEQRLQAIDPTKLQVEHNARALGLLAKVLKELVSIERIMNTPKNATAEIEDRDAPPRNLEQFRQELEKRLDAMRQGRQLETADDADRFSLAEDII